MGDISEHFSRKEFECQCGCGFDTVDKNLLDILETARHKFNRPIKITSGCRCESHNKNVGGSENSQHKYGRAADFAMNGVEPKEVYEFLCRGFKNEYGFGLYEGWVHVDSRNKKERW